MTALDRRHDRSRITLDQLFEALAHPSRRRLLAALHTGSPRDQDDLESILQRDQRTDRQRVPMELHHRHLPKLDASGYLDWDRATGTVARGDRFDEVRPVLEFLDEDVPAARSG